MKSTCQRWTPAVFGVALLLCCEVLLAQPGPMGPRRGPREGAPPPRGADDREEVLEWARQRMPNLHKMIVEKNRPRPFFSVARMRYRGQRQIENDPDTLERMLKNIKLEDEAFGYIIELETAKPQDRSELREKIRATFRTVYAEYLDQRAERIERLKERLREEQRRLEDERAQTDTRVDQQMARFGVDSEPATRESAEPTENTMASPARVP